MVELADERHHVLVDLGEVHDPAALGIDLAFDDDLDMVAVAVHARALVAGRHLREEVRRFEPIGPFEPRPHGERVCSTPTGSIENRIRGLAVGIESRPMRAWYLLVACALAACGGPTTTKLPGVGQDAAAGERHGRRGAASRPARGIVHLHSPYSHDACDGMPRDAGGAPNEPCLRHLRAALCTTQIDFAALTDHDDSMADEECADAVQHARQRSAGDERGRRSDRVADHVRRRPQVLVTVGGENELMPIMLDHHVARHGRGASRRSTTATMPAAAAAMRAAGGTGLDRRTPSSVRSTQLLEIAPDGIEVYNLHANIDPKIRGRFLGLDAGRRDRRRRRVRRHQPRPSRARPRAARRSSTPNPPAIARWNELLAEGRKVAATAGSDAHENALPVMLADGERGDSYRRVLRWFGNIALVADPTDPTQIEAALARRPHVRGVRDDGHAGRLRRPRATGGATAELGETVASAATLEVDVPTVRGPRSKFAGSRDRGHGLVHRRRGRDTIARDGSGPASQRRDGESGAYRVEISIMPRHLGPYLRDLGTALADRELPWIYASPIYVE